jgi:transcription initiation factor TFIIH subunit 4
VSTPPPVAAAAMKECVLDEYATKHRISIDRFLQLRIFVKVHDR